MHRRKHALSLLCLFFLIVLYFSLLYPLSGLGSPDSQEYDFVDNKTSDIDASPDKGTHSNFTAQQYGPDSIYDTLTEENTGGGAMAIAKVGTDTSGTGTALTLSFSHTLVTGSNRLVVVVIGIENGAAIDVDSVTYGGVAMTKAVEGITGTSGYRFLAEIWYILEDDLSSDGSKTVQISCSGTVTSLEINGFCAEYTGVNQGVPEATDNTDEPSPADATIENTISPSDDSWVISGVGCGNSGSFRHGQGQVEVLDFRDSSSTFAVAELRGASGETSLSSTFSATANRLERVAVAWNGSVEVNYELDLEGQWTSTTYDLPNKELCIYGGTMGSENIRVDVWTGSAWQNLFTDLTNGWNNISVTDYLVASTFTIRLKGGTETGDTSQDSWEIDCTLLHTWGTPPIANFTYTPEYPYTGETVTFNASDSYDPDGAIVSYFWDFGDGANGTDVIATHSYADDGTFPVALTVTDNDGLSDTASADVTVFNRPPVAIFTESAETVYTGETITFNASESYDPDGIIFSYFWDFGDGTNATDTIVDHTYADDGNYTVTLTVTDDDDATASTSTTKTVLNRPPIAIFTESAEMVYTSEVILFNASDSYDLDGTIVGCFWDFGDGTNATGITVEHAYTGDGNYTVTLIVTDDDGSTDFTSATKTVLNRSPVALFTESAQTVYTGETIDFNATESYDPDGVVIAYFWDFGDGTNTTGMLVSHPYADNGTYTVTLIVTDDDGAIGSANSTKYVNNRPPVASFTYTPDFPAVDETVTFNASGSYDPDGYIVTYFWDFGDGTNATGAVTTHSYANNGTYTVTLNVTDNDWLIDSESKTIDVEVLTHDVAVISVTPSSTEVYRDEFLNISVVIKNEGQVIETFNVTVILTNAAGWQLVEEDGRLAWLSDGHHIRNALLSTYITVPFDNPMLVFDTKYNIELLWDYGFVQISTDGGTTWTSLENNYTTYDYNLGAKPEMIANLPGLTGTSDGWPDWVTMAFNLSDYAGQTVMLGFRCWNSRSPATFWEGWYIDNITVNGVAIPNETFEPYNPNAITIQTRTINDLAPGNQTTLTFTWNTTGSPLGNYIVGAVADILPSEINKADNTFIDGWVHFVVSADLNGDGIVNMRDIGICVDAFGSTPEHPNWNPVVDLNDDGKVDMRDVGIVVGQFGKTIP